MRLLRDEIKLLQNRNQAVIDFDIEKRCGDEAFVFSTFRYLEKIS